MTAGIMISASHNPFHDNGIKLINCHGEKMEQEVIDRIEAYLDSDQTLPYAVGGDIGRVIDYASGRNRYIGYLISLATHSYKDIKVALDCANGSAWMIAESVFEALGAETHVINNTPNGLNINDNCGSTHIQQLQQYVKDNHMTSALPSTATPTAAWRWTRRATWWTGTASSTSTAPT